MITHGSVNRCVVHDPDPFGAQVAAHGREDAGVVGLFRRGAGHNPHDFGQRATRCLTQIFEADGAGMRTVHAAMQDALHLIPLFMEQKIEHREPAINPVRKRRKFFAKQ